MKKINRSPSFSIFLLLFILITSCSKEEKEEAEKVNQPPSCDIMAPVNGLEITKGETIIISVEASDSDGEINEVRFFVDETIIGEVADEPYILNWTTENEALGQHAIKATSIDNNGKSTSDNIDIVLVEHSGEAPIAGFTASPSNGYAPLTVIFSDQSINGPESWYWNFGDGDTSVLQNPSHTYENNGIFKVRLITANGFGADTLEKPACIRVDEAGEVPVAVFQANPSMGFAPLTVSFTDQSINGPDHWSWDFGDGNSSVEQNPEHTYDNIGTYTVSLLASNEFGSNTISMEDLVNVKSPGPGIFFDARDAKSYCTVDIGNQTWMAGNLKYDTTDSWIFDEEPGNEKPFGRLYSWEAAMTACPSGWHLPSDDEWKQLEMFLGMSQYQADGSGFRGSQEGYQMKATSGWDDNGNGSNSSGFKGVPAGCRNYIGNYGELGDEARWWSSTEFNTETAYERRLYFDSRKVYRTNYLKLFGYSVRCVMD
jgi:uncharacterized protein (TIGR02145 family)